MGYNTLFEPLTIGDVQIKNRIAMSPMNMVYSNPNGYVSDQNLAWYAARAKGGFGLIITECIVVNPHKWAGSETVNPAKFTDYRQSRYLHKMAMAAKSFGAKMFIQLSPGWGRQGHPNIDTPGTPSAAPSCIPMRIDLRNGNRGWEKQIKRSNRELFDRTGLSLDLVKQMNDEEYKDLENNLAQLLEELAPELVHLLFGDMPRELTVKEIVELEDRMAAQAAAAYKIGFDGVEIHSPHGYLIHQFLSKRSNKRIDEYGADSMENRARFLTNIIQKIRAKVGPEKPLGARFSGAELMPDGVTQEEAQEFVKLAVEAGCNFVNISQGCYENPGAFAPDGENEFTQYGKRFKQSAGDDVPVIAPGFITPETAASALTESQLDMVALGRQAIADPFWPAKVNAGRVEDIVKCTRCNQCYMNLFEAKWLTCSVNPTAGFESRYPELWRNDKRVSKFISKAAGLPEI